MTVDELEALIKRATAASGCTVLVGSLENGNWEAVRFNSDTNDDIDNGTMPEVIAKLKEWATPPKPATLTIEVPFEWAWSRARNEFFRNGDSNAVDAICKDAIKPWAQS